MPENDKPVLVYSTFPSFESAEHAGGTLVDERMAACANILPGMTSIYIWQGTRHRDSEVVLILKTRLGLAEAAIGRMRGLHPYTNPAILVLPVVAGSQDFLAWILEQTGADAGR